jgi:class 3 adenylate cyclase
MNCGQAMALACPNCGTELPTGAAFCFNCGHKLASPQDDAQPKVEPKSQPAAQMAADISPTQSYLAQYIPQELLSKLDAAREWGAMEGERRIVTMLFCDVKGSTAAAGQLDPEEWADIINGTFEHLIKPVYRYEGMVARLMGDGILAFFGAPIAHEDDPQRAILAGLDILDGIQGYQEQVKRQWDLDLDVRVGINTGLVVVGAVGSDLRMEYTAVGDAINLAARMEQTAQSGTVQIAEPTYKLVAPLFEAENLGGIQVKGKQEPVQAYQVMGLKSAPGQLRGIEGLEAPMIGRDAEMHTLRGAIIELRQGRGQIVSVIGEAGLGKSRLIAELRQMPSPVSKTQAKLRWEEGRSLSYETTTPYAPFIDLFNNCIELTDGQSDEEKFERITTRITEVMPERVGEIAPFIASLLEITLTGEALQRVKYLEPPQLRSRVFQAVSEFLEAMASNQPVVLVFDDVHWIDPTSFELLEQLLPLSERVMLMIIALFRPRRQEPSWRFHEIAEREFSHRYTTMRTVHASW